MTKLILYSKPGCHLCEGLEEKLEQVPELLDWQFELEIRDITQNEGWFKQYQYEIPVLCHLQNDGESHVEKALPRLRIRWESLKKSISISFSAIWTLTIDTRKFP